MKPQHLTALSALACTGALGALGACGGGGAGPQASDVTVTVTPTVTAPAAGSKPAAPTVPASDDKGRNFDFGTVVSATQVRGVTVLELDRWTWKGLDDGKLASQGVPLGAFKGKLPYENQNDRLTYTLPVVSGARILYHHCITADQPLQTKSVTAKDLTALGDRENTVLVALDDQGRVTTADNIPGCPG